MAHIDWSAMAQFVSPSFDGDALETYLDIVGDPSPLIRRGLDMIPSPEWSLSADGIATLFGLANSGHCFHVVPHSWAKYHEPQITAGFAHFLNRGSRGSRIARAVALVKAAALCAGNDTALIDTFHTDNARCVAEENRTDILVELSDGSRRIGASIEAKFGHHLTKGQLPKALTHVRQECGWAASDTTLLVVAPDTTTLDQTILRQNKRFGWRATSWWALLSNVEQFTDPAHDCDDYRRFRRTVWHRAY